MKKHLPIIFLSIIILFAINFDIVSEPKEVYYTAYPVATSIHQGSAIYSDGNLGIDPHQINK